MKINASEFLEKSKPELKKIISDLSKDFSYVSILGEDSTSKTYYVSR